MHQRLRIARRGREGGDVKFLIGKLSFLLDRSRGRKCRPKVIIGRGVCPFGWFGGVLAGLGLLVHCESACQDGERRGQESPWRVKGLFDTRESSWVRWLEILTFAIAEVCLQLRPTKSFRHVTVELDLKQESRVCNLSCFLTKYATSGPAQR